MRGTGKIGREFGAVAFEASNSLRLQIRRGTDSGGTFTSKTLFKLDEVFLGALFSVHDGTGVVLADYAFRIRLNGRWGEVWFINEFGWEMLNFRHPELDELSGFRFHVEAGFGIGARVV